MEKTREHVLGLIRPLGQEYCRDAAALTGAKRGAQAVISMHVESDRIGYARSVTHLRPSLRSDERLDMHARTCCPSRRV